MKSENSTNEFTFSFRPQMWMWLACLIVFAVGAAGLAGAFATRPKEAWLWLVVDFVIFLGISHGVLIWAATFRMTQTRWTPAINRLGHSAIFFLPFLGVVLILLLTGAANYVPWIAHPIASKAAWLNLPGMIGRDIASLLILWILLFMLVRWSLSADAKARQNIAITAKDQFRLTAIATASILVYTITGSIIAYDFIMSLSPDWYSTMFAPYFWITNMYMGMAMLILLSAIFRKVLNIKRFINAEQFHDMGNLLLGFSLFSMGLFFAQYLTIWYGNMPEETHFIILRYFKGEWAWLGWTAFIVGYAIPFLILQSRQLKMNAGALSGVAVLVLLGVCAERYVLVVPSIAPHKVLICPVGILGLLAFLGAFAIGVLFFLSKYSPVSYAALELRNSEALSE